jgi:hypothetical protein
MMQPKVEDHFLCVYASIHIEILLDGMLSSVSRLHSVSVGMLVQSHEIMKASGAPTDLTVGMYRGIYYTSQ